MYDTMTESNLTKRQYVGGVFSGGKTDIRHRLTDIAHRRYWTETINQESA